MKWAAYNCSPYFLMIMKNKTIKLDPRLSLAVSFIKGNVVADIGTDHAYIPIYLLTSGKCNYAIASDINEGPLMRAKANAMSYGVDKNIYFGLTDGLQQLPLEEKGVTDIIICGMGGELIANIIEASDYTKKNNVNLILQPMSSIDELRTYLAENGFEIKDEGICSSQGKIYQCINCCYTGNKYSLSPAEAVIGKVNITKGNENPYFATLIAKLTEQTKHIILGKQKGGNDSDKEKALLAELEIITQKLGDNNEDF